MHVRTVYGQNDPAATYTLNGFQYSDTKSSATTGEVGCAMGRERVKISVDDGAIKYTLGSGAAGNLTITPATLTINASNATKVYGQNDPAATYTLNGFQYSDTKSSATTG